MLSKYALRSCVIVLLLGSAYAILAQDRMPQLKFSDRKLANGLRILSVVDSSSPTVAIQMWYHVGSKDDPPNRSGFAHLFEHIMFKSTKNMKSEMMDRLTEDVGGFNNASTGDDVTIYYEVVPSNYLETLIWAEADRLSGLNVDEANFKSERDVVKEEFRQSVLAPPYGKFEYYLQQKSFAAHPYKRPTIGSIEDLDAASLKDVQDFHSTYYRPDNATLVVVGDFDQRQLDAWVDKYFGPIAKPTTPLPRVNVQEPGRKAEQRFTERGSNDLPAVGISYLAPKQADTDQDALRIADVILSGGESSRLYHSLVYDQQLAAEVNSSDETREDVSLFVVTAVLSEGKKPEDVERSLLAEIKKLQDAPVSQSELEKAKNQIITEQVRERETSNGKALALGEAAVLLGDPSRVNTDLARLQAVTTADIQRVMKKYFSDTSKLVLYYLPEAKSGKLDQSKINSKEDK
ncbi:MAG TPA: pitrilysin family protein [Pyrinomonadaceae bacterium]|nr:pitrilysin family protein [Pyrinomonadaceae bacterium]